MDKDTSARLHLENMCEEIVNECKISGEEHSRKNIKIERNSKNSPSDESKRKDLFNFTSHLKEAIAAADSQAQHTVPQKITMAACKIRFSGQQKPEAVKEFINAVQIFKLLENINDEDALRGVSYLFTGIASTWWQGIQKEVTTWSQCLDLIEEHFAPKKRPPQIYMDFFAERQDEKTSINQFIIRKRALLAQLPEGRHNEEVQLDMLYGLLHFKFRQHIRREDICSFRELLQKAQDIEQILLEASINSGEKTKSKRCSYCNYRGHTVEECRRRQQKQNMETKMQESKSA